MVPLLHLRVPASPRPRVSLDNDIFTLTCHQWGSGDWGSRLINYNNKASYLC
ncbi:MAG: hypothetical protein F6K41_02845 [Symploca sp. SIO3E6]|nr:hypothetical protein [Caldora sp. SIO3E6]